MSVVRSTAAACLAVGAVASTPVCAKPSFACAGFALLNGAQLVCSQVDPDAPAQSCNFSWTLTGPAGPTVVSGAFTLARGVVNATVYQGSGFAYALGSPVVLCEAGRSEP